MSHCRRSEAAWITAIQQAFAQKNVLDLCQAQVDAVSLPKSGYRLNVDCCQAGLHFDWPSRNPAGCGQRALLAALSDLAAVAAMPKYLLLSAVIPSVSTAAEIAAIDAVFEGMAQAASEQGISLLGGNVSRGPLALHCVVIGDDSFPLARRQHSRHGDLLWLTGTHGDAMLQLFLEKSGGTLDPHGRYWRPLPRWQWGQALRKQPWVMAISDVSDGWLKDVHNLLEAGYGLNLNPHAVPRSSTWLQITAKNKRAKQASYWGGDDYELAFLTREVTIEKVAAVLAELQVDAACIGKVQQAPGIQWQTPPEFEPPLALGYDSYV